MGTFVKDNIGGINIGSKSSDVSGKTVQSSNIDISSIERGNSDFSSNSNISSSVDFGDLFNEKATASEVSSSSMTNGSTNVEGMNQTSSSVQQQGMSNSKVNQDSTNQTSSSVQQQGMNNDKVNQDSANQQTGNAQSASLSNGKNEGNNTSQATGTASSQGTASSGNQGSSTGQTGGSATGASTSSGRGTSGSTGGATGKASGNSMSGGSTGSGQGGHGGHKAGGVEVKSSSVQGATRPTALNNNSSMQQTGTTVSQKSVKSSHVETNTSKAENNTGGFLGKAVRWFVKEVVNVIDVVESTKTVIKTSVLSAVGNIVEAVVIDGLVGYVVAGALDFFGEDDVANDLRKFAARDLVGEANKWFYEETDRGKHINEKSLIKYDSAVAKGITSLSEMTIKITAATALSIVPGGVFIVAGIGALEGIGNAAEGAYQNALANGEEDLTLSVWSNLGILGSGALDAVAWVFNAKLGQGFLEIAGDIGKIGIKETALNFGKQLFSKDTLENILNPKNLLANMGQSALQSSGEIGKIFSKFMNGEEIKPEDWWDLTRTFGTYLLINIGEDVLRDTISGYKARVNEVNEITLRAESHNTTVLDTAERKVVKKTIGDPPYTIKTDMTDEELIKFFNEYYGAKPPITSLAEFKQFGVPTRALDIEVKSDGTYGINWVENNGFNSDIDGNPICEDAVIKGGEHMDRYGNPSGVFTGKMDMVDGKAVGANYDARSLPYAEGSQVRTEFVVSDGIEISSKTMSEKVNSLPDAEKAAVLDQMKWDGVKYKTNPDGTVIIPEVKVGEIAPAYGHKGGGTQYQFPIRMAFFEDWGWIKKVK